MDIKTRTENGVTVIAVTGEIDGRTAPQAQESILPVVQTSDRLVLDLSGVTFLSSAGLRLLLLLYRQATARRSRVALTGLSAEIKDTMEMTGFLGYFEVANSLPEAIQSVS